MDRVSNLYVWKVYVIMKYLKCKWRKSNVFKFVWYREVGWEMMCLRMVNYLVIWNIILFIYVEEKLKMF